MRYRIFLRAAVRSLLAAVLGAGLVTTQALGQRVSAPDTTARTGPTESSVSGLTFKLVPAAPTDTDTYKLVPTSTGARTPYRLVPASPGDRDTYKLVMTSGSDVAVGFGTPTVQLAQAAAPAPAPATPAQPGVGQSGTNPAALQNGGTAPQQFYVGGQNTEIVQHVLPFHSPYQGTNSFLANNETEMTSTVTIFLGYRISGRLEGYIDPESSRGKGLSQGFGLGSFANGEVVRTPSLSADFYLARYFLRYTISTGAGREDVEQGETQLAGTHPTHRVVLTGGGLAVADLFDVNRYANSPRTQFMSWGLINDAAYDYAADTRGYTVGVASEWINPDYAVRFGAFQMPTVANGIDLSDDYKKNAGYNFEVELHPSFLATKAGPGIVRVMYMRNLAHMGNYRDAANLARATDTTPDITAVEKTGSHKYGYYLNFEQPLADGGNTGLFGRAGFNDGQTEDFVYTEADRHVSLGGQLSGVRWHRPDDVFALAVMQNDLSAAHKDYLAAGGLGFLLGDGRLNYGPERTLETYYNYQLSKHGAATTLFVSPDFQYIRDPGYNQDRGPVAVVSGRFHLEF